MRLWQSRGWTIGLHGYQHEYVTRNCGILGRNNFSEFAGLSPQEQEHKLKLALRIFQREGVDPLVWVAPGHSFDEVTLAILKNVGILRVSDGYFLFPHRDSSGILWVPQQLGKFRFMPFGVWTVCNHYNKWTAKDIAKLQRDVQRFRMSIVDFDSVVDAYKDRRRTCADLWFSKVWLTAARAKDRLEHSFPGYQPR